MQVRRVHGLLGGTIRSLMHTLLEEKEDMTDEQGCAFIQGMDCLASLVKQQPSHNKQKLNAQLPCFRFVDLRQELSTCLGFFPDVVTSHSIALLQSKAPAIDATIYMSWSAADCCMVPCDCVQQYCYQLVCQQHVSQCTRAQAAVLTSL